MKFEAPTLGVDVREVPMKTLLALFVLATAAHAGQTTYSTNYNSAPANWSHTYHVPKHAPQLGTLQSVTITVRSTLSGTLRGENPAPTAATYFGQLGAEVRVSRPNATEILHVEPSVVSDLEFGAFDGSLDFAGASGVTLSNPPVTREMHVVLQSAADLALFTATSNGEEILLGVDAIDMGYATGPGPLVTQFTTNAAAQVTVAYGFKEVIQSASVPSTTNDWQQSAVFAKHDPTLGPLRSVRLRARASLSGFAGVESPSATPIVLGSELDVRTTVSRPDTTLALSFDTVQNYLDRFEPFDGSIDFGGTSGVLRTGVQVDSGAGATLTSAADLALFTASTPGETIALGLRGAGYLLATGPGGLSLSFQSASSVDLDVCYDYTAPLVLFCFGDGSGASCPCGNASAVGAQQGCVNSLGLGGQLRGSGAAQIGSDTLVLSASNLPSTSSALFFQGTSMSAAVFGDGLRCVAGSVLRLGTSSASGGVATYPPQGYAVSDAGYATIGTTLYYQAWYRNAVSYCTASPFNLTNGLSITW
jgi:hypothetical protein